MRPGIMEVIIVLAVIILLVAPKQLPKLASSLNQSIKNFKEGAESETNSTKNAETTEA